MSTHLTKAELLDHFKHPRNKKELKNPDFSSGQHNPSCGDSVSICGNLSDDTITQLAFTGSGCIISQSAASMLTEYCKSKSVSEVLAMTKDDIQKMLGIPLGPNRLQCALLSLEALKLALQKYKK